MIEAKEVVRLMRHQLNDFDETKFSDYDVLQALNQTLRQLSVSLANKGAQVLEVSEDYDEAEMNEDPEAVVDFTNDGVKLPDDCASIISVQDTTHGEKLQPATSRLQLAEHGYRMYYVAGDRIFTKVDAFRLNYYRALAELTSLDETIDLPRIFLDPLVKITRVVLENGENDVMTQTVTTELNRVLPGRRYSNSRVRMPFYV